MQFLKDLLDNKERDDWWQDYKEFCTNIKEVDAALYVRALPFLLKKLENNYAIRDLRVALEIESKGNASYGAEVYRKTLETNNPKFNYRV